MSDGSLLDINIDFLGVGDVLTCAVKIIVEIGSLTLGLIDMKLEYIEALVSAGDIVDALHGDLLGEIAISINDAILIVLEDLADGLTVGTSQALVSASPQDICSIASSSMAAEQQMLNTFASKAWAQVRTRRQS